MKANLFDVLKAMNIEHEGSVHAYFLDNIQNINAGKKGWGSIKIAITTEDAQVLMQSMMGGHLTKSVMLFVVDRDVQDLVAKEIQEYLDKHDRMLLEGRDDINGKPLDN